MANNLIVDFGDLGLDLARLLLRITVGGLLILHGYRKSNNRFQGTIGWFNSLGYPFNIAGGRLSAYSASLIEILAGFFLLVGFLTQFFAGVVFGQMAVATYVAVVKEKSDLISLTGKPGKYGYELDVHYVLGALALVFLGGGAFSIDAIVDLISNPIFS